MDIYERGNEESASGPTAEHTMRWPLTCAKAKLLRNDIKTHPFLVLFIQLVENQICIHLYLGLCTRSKGIGGV